MMAGSVVTVLPVQVLFVCEITASGAAGGGVKDDASRSSKSIRTSRRRVRTDFLLGLALAMFSPHACRASTAAASRLRRHSAWQVSASDDVKRLRSAPGAKDRRSAGFRLRGGVGLCGGATGAFGVRTATVLLLMRGDGPPALQFKLVDASGQFVCVNRRTTRFARMAARSLKRHRLRGAVKDRDLRRGAQIELVAGDGAAERAGLLRELSFRLATSGTPLRFSGRGAAELQPARAEPPGLRWGRDGFASAFPPLSRTTGLATRFPATARVQWFVLHWLPALTSRHDRFSDDGELWRTVRRVLDRAAAPSASLPESETRFASA